MSNGRNSPPLHPPPASDHRRRSSVTGQTFHDLFGRSSSYANQQGGTPQFSGPITTAAVNAQRRRLSLTTIGLGASPGQTSPFLGQRTRNGSISSANSGSVDESPFEEDYAPVSASSSNPATPFARRLSFGARALRDVRQSNASVGNPNGEGYNFAENLRSRAERGSVSGPPPATNPAGTAHQRAKSVAIVEPPVQMPKQQQVPDAMQERILKGDFYMD